MNKIYQLTPGHKFNLMIALTGDKRDKLVEVTDDYVYLNGFPDDNFGEAKIPGVEEDTCLTAYYSLGLKPWKFTKKSLESLKKPNLDFYAITAPGVNIRAYGDSKAPRLGYFKARSGWEEEYVFLRTEDEDVDTEYYTRSFSPWHPETGTVFASCKDPDTDEEWTNIIVEDWNPDYEPVVSSKFVKQMKTEPLVSMQQISEDDWKSSIWKMNSVKYPGLWFMIKELPYEGEGEADMLYIGKEIDGMIVFKWCAGRVVSSGVAGRFFLINDNGYYYFIFGNDIAKNGDELDLSKINDNDFETLFRAVEQNNFIPIIVKIADGDVREFQINEKFYNTNAAE